MTLAVPTRSNHLQSRYEVEDATTQHRFVAVSYLSMTSDIWKPRYQETSFLGIIGHYIDENWNLKTLLVGFEPIQSVKPGARIADLHSEIINKYNLAQKIVSITTDNGLNMVKATEKLCESSTDLTHVQSAAHVTNLVAQEMLKSTCEDIGNLRTVNIIIRNSTALAAKLHRLCRAYGEPQLRPQLNVVTRWIPCIVC